VKIPIGNYQLEQNWHDSVVIYSANKRFIEVLLVLIIRYWWGQAMVARDPNRPSIGQFLNPPEVNCPKNLICIGVGKESVW